MIATLYLRPFSSITLNIEGESTRRIRLRKSMPNAFCDGEAPPFLPSGHLYTR